MSDVIQLSQPQQLTAQQLSATQVERSLSILNGQSLGGTYPLIRAQRREVYYRQRDPPILIDYLRRYSPLRTKTGPQRFVPPDDLLQAPLQRRHIHLALQP